MPGPAHSGTASHYWSCSVRATGHGIALAPSLPGRTAREAGMAVNLNTYLGVHAQALTLESQRTQLLAANLANADTPGYKARDIDFKSALAAAGGSAGNNGSGTTLSTTTTNAAHLAASQGNAGTSLSTGDVKYRVP